MQRKILVSAILLGSLVVASVFGVAAYSSAKASGSATNTVANMSFGRDGERGFGGYTSEALATALGITVDELNAAYEQANAAALKQAVEAGLITQTQADEMAEKGQAFPFGGRWSGWLSEKGIDYEALLADALGISVEELQAAYQQAFYASIDQAVADGKMTQEQADLRKGQYALQNDSEFTSAMQAAFETAVKEAVDAGVITQAQADQILLNGFGLGFAGDKKPGMSPMHGLPEGRGGPGHHGMGEKMPQGEDTTETDS
ncbi:MAG: hypothetical protein JXB15_07690 [Anaerolineales bacterium]|nr:hypothetical protein [Anaerolineales bacterium]